jgi:hypothetical protein
MTQSNQKKKQYSALCATCIYIALVIAITQVVSSKIQEYVIDNHDYLSAVIMFTVIVVIYGLTIFFLVAVFKPFREFLMRMFGVQSIGETSNKSKNYLSVFFRNIDTSDIIFMLIPSILSIIAFSVSVYSFYGIIEKITTTQTVDAEVINGLLSISGILFAFQAFFLKRPEKMIRKGFFGVILMIEIIALSVIGSSYINDVTLGIFPSIATLYATYFSLLLTLINTGYFIAYDLFFPSQNTKQP